MTTDDDDPRKAEAQELQRRIDNGTITAREIISKTLDIHRHKTPIISSPESLESNLITACRLRNLFLYVFYQTNSSKSKYFQSVIDKIRDKYFNDTRNGDYASADIFGIEILHWTFVVMKKNRITKEQITEELFQDKSEEYRKAMVESVMQTNPISYYLTNGIPFHTGIKEDDQAMDNKVKALFKKHSAMFG
jgi:hypothetical protein